MRNLLLLLLALVVVGCGSRAPVTVPEAGELKKEGPGVHQETANVPGIGEVKYTVSVPEGYDGKTPVPLVLALHYGYDGAKPAPYTGKGMIDAFRSGLADLGAVVIAPDALGGDWRDAKNETAVVWLAKSAMKTYAIDPKKVVITGYSMGGEGTLFIGSRHQDLFTGAIAVAAPVSGGTEWKIPLYVIHSEKDEVVPYSSAKRNADAVKAAGGKVEFKSVSGLTHYKTGSYGPYVGDGVKWLKEQWK